MMRPLPAAYQLDEAIRPRQCPATHHANTGSCPSCGGLGFLYPNPPDWWLEWEWPGASAGQFIPSWRLWCDVTWRVLKVIEDTE